MGRAAHHHTQLDGNDTTRCRCALALSREVVMRTTGWVMFLVMCLGAAGWASAADRDEPVLAVVRSAAGHTDISLATVKPGAVSAIEPRVSLSVPGRVRDKLQTAFALAVQRIEEVPSCGELFADLGTTGLDMLSTTIYYPADPREETTTCRRGSAFTWVGAAPTRLCRRFEALSDSEAAMVVVHEALHHAGLDEQPRDPNAMSSRAINQMVREACGF
jgi:hypothetical protein